LGILEQRHLDSDLRKRRVNAQPPSGYKQQVVELAGSREPKLLKDLATGSKRSFADPKSL
jgi:hypothetical protein